MRTGVSWQMLLLFLNAVGLPALILFYVKDRRKNAAESSVEEATVQNKVDLSSVSAIEARIGMIEKAFDAERASMGRQITALVEQLNKQREEHDAERQEWRQERLEMREHIAQLETKIYTLENRPPQTRARRSDNV